MPTLQYVLDVADISGGDIGRVGGKNASLGELFRSLSHKGVGVLDGFATTSDAYRRLIGTGDLESTLRSMFTTFDSEDLPERSSSRVASLALSGTAEGQRRAGKDTTRSGSTVARCSDDIGRCDPWTQKVK